MDASTKVQLYVELFNKYIYFYEKGLTAVTPDMLQVSISANEFLT